MAHLQLAPTGMRLVPDPGVRVVGGGSVLVGGAPVRVLRLTPAGARQVTSWFAGTPVSGGTSARTLARKLLDAGIAHPDVTALLGPADSGHVPRLPSAADVTVVIPVRDRHAELARCLSGLKDLPHVIVVDDASVDPRAIARIAARHGAAVVHRPVNGGPGAARNTGIAAAETEFVAFLDSDCVPHRGWLQKLLPHFTDPAVGAVAPRIVPHEKGTSWLARYEGASSTLDMGTRPSVVRPGARVWYVPGAALVIRKAAAGDGFRDGMFVGEDVDFVWQMAASGWRVRYEPAAFMGHDHRVTFRSWFARRTDYGTSAAALEELHPGTVRPLYVSWWTAVAWAAVLAGRPVSAGVLTATATALLARRLSRIIGERWPFPAPNGLITATSAQRKPSLPGGAAWGLAARLAGGGTVATARPLGSAISRTWWPVAIPAALAMRKLRLPVAVLVLTPPLLDWADRKPPLDPARYVAARLLDDIAYSIGVWQGCLVRRTVRPLLPMIGGARPGEPGGWQGGGRGGWRGGGRGGWQNDRKPPT